jgi:hypothetical protein
MSIKNWNAGIIRPVAVAPAGPYQDGAAPGVWTLDQVAYWRKQNLWPIAGSGATPIALFGGNDSTNVIDKVLLSTTGNATDFGDMTTIRRLYGAAASITRAVFGGGRQGTTNYNTIDYVQFSTNGNTTNFGNLTAGKFVLSATSNNTRAIFGGGYDVSMVFSDAEYITIASTGNATDFGDLSVTRENTNAAASNCHGGL